MWLFNWNPPGAILSEGGSSATSHFGDRFDSQPKICVIDVTFDSAALPAIGAGSIQPIDLEFCSGHSRHHRAIEGFVKMRCTMGFLPHFRAAYVIIHSQAKKKGLKFVRGDSRSVVRFEFKTTFIHVLTVKMHDLWGEEVKNKIMIFIFRSWSYVMLLFDTTKMRPYIVRKVTFMDARWFSSSMRKVVNQKQNTNTSNHNFRCDHFHVKHLKMQSDQANTLSLRTVSRLFAGRSWTNVRQTRSEHTPTVVWKPVFRLLWHESIYSERIINKVRWVSFRSFVAKAQFTNTRN